MQGENLLKKGILISTVSSVEPLREVVRQLADTFNDPQNRESNYFDFYDDSLVLSVTGVVRLEAQIGIPSISSFCSVFNSGFVRVFMIIYLFSDIKVD
jgi:hypothetical protein